MIVEGHIRIPYQWAAGPVVGRFLKALRDEQQILGIRCSACAKVIAPPQGRCPFCDGACKEFVPVGPQGVLETWSKGFGIVRLDGADTGFVHLVRGDLRPGMRMQAVFAKERKAHILDIAYFRPCSE